MELNLSSADVVGQPQGGGAARGGKHAPNIEGYGLTPERARALRQIYFEELAGRCSNKANKDPSGLRSLFSSGSDEKGKSKAVDWDGFVQYADEKEKGTISATV